MHTDEFEISLSRELSVCKNTIMSIKKTLSVLERKHNKTTEVFMEELRRGNPSATRADEGDSAAWRDSYAALKHWEDLERQYHDAYRMMKI
jgi:hypothetical protein